jgi:ribosomal-protein-serine acetyltransferase
MESILLPDTSRLRLLDDADAEELYELIDSNRARLGCWLPWAAEQTLADTRAFIRRAREQSAANDGFQMAILCEQELAGVIGYHGIDWGRRSTSLGYWLGVEHEGRGTATQAVRVLTGHALTVWRLNRVEIRAAVANQRSRAIPERLGFRHEGTLREAERVGDRYLDCAVYSMLAADWRDAGTETGAPR